MGGCSQTGEHNNYSNKLGTCCVCMPQPKLPAARSLWQTELVQRQCRIRPVPVLEAAVSLLALSAGNTMHWHKSVFPRLWKGRQMGS